MHTRYKERRAFLRTKVTQGDILLFSSRYVPRNYADNTYPFHQDSCFYYYTGLGKLSDAILLIREDGTETLYAADPAADDVIWSGPCRSVAQHAAESGIEHSKDISAIYHEKLEAPQFLEPYDVMHEVLLSALAPKLKPSESLRRAIIAQRSIKTSWEVEEIEEAIGLTAKMLQSAQAAICEGVLESEVCAALLLPALAKARQQAFNPIVSVRGETLHNEYLGNRLSKGDILLIDCGAESAHGYCGDITRVFAVSGAFDRRQQEIYDLVLSMQRGAISKTAQRGVSMRQVHLEACHILAEGMCSLGLMRGSAKEAVEAGAHALFLPHGIGHMLGLDAHDMENLGDEVGYETGEKRSTQFGLHALRMARTLEAGHVITIEPGIYFIPELISRWEEQALHKGHIDYARVREYIGFGGIRIEDDVLITRDGSRVLGPGIPK